MALSVVSDACPKTPDGRTRHVYRKDEATNEFVCANAGCAQVSDPADRWEQQRAVG